jgi:hypothetical protein
MRLEGIGQLKKSNHLIGNRPRNYPAYSIVPQPTTPPCIEGNLEGKHNFGDMSLVVR